MNVLRPKTPALAEYVETTCTKEMPSTALVIVPTIDGLAANALRLHREYEANLCNAADKAIETGRHLIELKALVRKEYGHGYWEAFLAEKFPFTSRTARNYMQLARKETRQINVLGRVSEPLSALKRHKAAKIVTGVEKKK